MKHALLEDAHCAHLHKNLGDFYYRAQRYEEAVEAYARVIRLSPSHGPDVYLKLGNVQYRRGAFAEARAAWEEALARDPSNDIVRANLDSLRHVGSSADTDLVPGRDRRLAGGAERRPR